MAPQHIRHFLHYALPVALLGAFGSSSACAADVDVAQIGPGYTEVGAALGPATELQIDLKGDVSARCRMASPPSAGKRLDFTSSGDVRSAFTLDCNTPFRLSVRSAQGGFAATEQHEGTASLIAYDMAIAVDTDAGMQALGWCSAEELSERAVGGCPFAGRGWSSGDATAINKTGSLTVRWNAAREGEKVALGEYRDTIIIDVAVRS